MFTIIGGDGKEYGPVTVEQLRGWIAGGRANLETKAKAAGSDEWRRLGDFAEFGPPADVPPPIAVPSAYTPAGAAPASPSKPLAEPAGRGARTGAAFINAFIYFFSMAPGSIFMGMRLMKDHPEMARGVVPNPGSFDLASVASSLLWVYAGLALAMLVQCIFLAINGQNIGKLIAGIRVVQAADDAPAGFVRGALLRFIVPVISIFCLNVIAPLGLVFLVVDYCFIFREDRRCLHDLIAGTKVVKA